MMHVRDWKDGERDIRVRLDSAVLEGHLAIPPGAEGVVIFVPGSGSCRHSPRNLRVAAALQRRGLGTVLLDLLSNAEGAEDVLTARFRFDTRLLAERVLGVTEWLQGSDEARHLPIGHLGVGTGAAAALIAAAEAPEAVATVVSQGGRPDLAGELLSRVQAPALLIVGGNDEPVLSLNQAALDRLERVREKKMVIVPGASHLFDEPGAIEEVARLSGEWFRRHLTGG